MANLSGILAVIFDFDDTLVPDSTSALLSAHGIDSQAFWGTEAKAWIERGYDPALAYLNLLLDKVGQGKPLGALTNDVLYKFGSTLDDRFYPGLPELFPDLRAIVSDYRDMNIEFYVISGGLQAIMDGSRIVRENFAAVYGSRLGPDPDTAVVRYIQRCITFTEKTRYLFEINKGIQPAKTTRNPYEVNKDVPPEKRRIPFDNMIYVGDGLTDIPCFSLVKKNRGVTFGVFDPSKEASAKRALLEFLKTERVVSMHAPRYGREQELGEFLRAAVAARCSTIQLRREEAE